MTWKDDAPHMQHSLVQVNRTRQVYILLGTKVRTGAHVARERSENIPGMFKRT